MHLFHFICCLTECLSRIHDSWFSGRETFLLFFFNAVVNRPLWFRTTENRDVCFEPLDGGLIWCFNMTRFGPTVDRLSFWVLTSKCRWKVNDWMSQYHAVLNHSVLSWTGEETPDKDLLNHFLPYSLLSFISVFISFFSSLLSFFFYRLYFTWFTCECQPFSVELNNLCDSDRNRRFKQVPPTWQ